MSTETGTTKTKAKKARDAEEPEATQTEATEPEATEPEATEPEATQTESTEPEATEPEAIEAAESEGEETKDATGEAEPESKPKGKAKVKPKPKLTPRDLLAGRRDRLTTALILVVLAAVAVTAVLQWREADRLRQEAGTQQQVRGRAAEFGQALLAYRHTDLQSSRARILRLASTDFGKSYETAFTGLTDVIGKYKADATATVRDTYVNEIDGDRAKAMVVLDSEVRSTAGTRRVLGTKLLLELIREKGQWRVSAMTSLEADDESMAKPDGTPVSPKASEGDPAVPAPSPGDTP